MCYERVRKSSFVSLVARPSVNKEAGRDGSPESEERMSGISTLRRAASTQLQPSSHFRW